MGIKKIVITVRRPGTEAVFRPGETLTGALRLHITGHKPHKLTRVLVKVRGKAVTHWTEASGSGGSTTRSEIQHLLRVDIPLCLKGQPITELPPGEHTLPFSCQLPDRLAPTMKIGEGKVRYSIKARAISAALFSFDGKTKCPIELTQHLDLNLDHKLSKPLMLSGTAPKPLFGKSPGRFSVYIERQGYTAGETIHVHVDGSEQLMQALANGDSVMKLKRSHLCKAGSHTRKGKKTLVVVKPRDWRHVQLVVPSGLQISIDNSLCNIINVTYYIKIKSPPLNLRLNLVIGTVPVLPS